MQITVTGHQLEITDALQKHVDTKLKKLGAHSDQITNVHVVLSVEKLEHRAEATVRMNGKDLFADVSSDDMYAAIDELSDKLARQLRRHKGRNSDHHARNPLKHVS